MSEELVKVNGDEILAALKNGEPDTIVAALAETATVQSDEQNRAQFWLNIVYLGPVLRKKAGWGKASEIGKAIKTIIGVGEGLAFMNSNKSNLNVSLGRMIFETTASARTIILAAGQKGE